MMRIYLLIGMCPHDPLHCVIRAKTNAPTCKRRLLKLPSRVEQSKQRDSYNQVRSFAVVRAAGNWRERVSWVAAVARVAVLSCWPLFIPRRRSSSRRFVVVAAAASCLLSPAAGSAALAVAMYVLQSAEARRRRWRRRRQVAAAPLDVAFVTGDCVVGSRSSRSSLPPISYSTTQPCSVLRSRPLYQKSSI